MWYSKIEYYKPPKVLLMFILLPCSLKITNVLTANITDFPGFLTLIESSIMFYIGLLSLITFVQFIHVVAFSCRSFVFITV